jgi:hypothetical protein
MRNLPGAAGRGSIRSGTVMVRLSAHDALVAAIVSAIERATSQLSF